ncbi:Citrate lyase subunit beta [Polaromonas vacuolata]|uniref:Citrate lyase subunit beta n=1 Tax=Polaromonas vacuolata TaxID=37448 RepID=A0A6H2HC06_9BURK|nr:CoA ester lyase [Polaromonas vacuolata]QJC57360.1 Citrate lyase subunit beta [Polaromonas vacuolata]
MSVMANNFSFNTLHSLLFVPALNEKFIASAHTRQADAVIFDLEDSIIHTQKNTAREALFSALGQVRPHGLPMLVRVNNEAVHFEADVRAAVRAGADAILIPKTDDADILIEVDQLISQFEFEFTRQPGTVKFIALIESPKGLFNIASILQTQGRLIGLGFGSEDFAASLGVEPDAYALSEPAQRIALAARAFDMLAWGLPGSISNFNDLPAFEQLVRKAKAFGFTGALAIHPNQISAINAAFRPSAAELALAERIIAAYQLAQDAGLGAVALDGKMIDAPVVERARRLMEKKRS